MIGTCRANGTHSLEESLPFHEPHTFRGAIYGDVAF
jgi:hypothetical protein